MNASTSSGRRVLGGAVRAFDLTLRVIVNLAVLLVILFLIALFTRGERPAPIGDGIAVLFDPAGLVVEEYDATPLDRAVNRMLGRDIPQVLLRDLREALLAAATDARVSIIVLDLGRLAPVSLSKLDELAEPLSLARANGKRVLAYSDAYGQSQYLLAAHADEIFVHPMGGVFIDGFSSYRLYMREALEKLSVDWHVFRAGEFKSYAEPYQRDEMSPEVREETAEWLGAMWALYQARVEAARELEAGTIGGYVDGMIDGVRGTGNLARYAEAIGLVDRAAEYDRFVARVADLVGPDENGDGFHGMSWRPFLASSQREQVGALKQRDRIGLVIARGAIVDGDPGMHVVGADRIGAMLRQARDDDRIKALVLRVDSPGGSAFASEQIRNDLERFRESGRPVVVSMSSVAASGGYWIALGADEIWASPATVTGSIGVVAMFPTFPRTLERLGLHSDGVGTTRFAGAARPDRPMTDEVRELVQLLVDGVYDDFVERVADAREMEAQAVDAIGGGRVWSGIDAQRIGLVDELGGLDDAIGAAAALAGIDEYVVTVLERPLSFRERLVLSLLDSRVAAPLAAAVARAQDRPLTQWLGRLEQELEFISVFRDPRHAYLYCFCDSP